MNIVLHLGKREYKIRLRWNFVITVLVLILILFFVLNRIEPFQDAFAPVTGRSILIDAGHGGIDAGVTGKVTGSREDDLNLSVAKKLQSHFEKSGARVVMTREHKDGIYDKNGSFEKRKKQDMQRRSEIINSFHVDLVISIHMNKYPDPIYYGAQTFYQRGSQGGKILAETIQNQMIQTLDRNNKRQAQASDYFILRCSTLPSVIVECGFMSNLEEEKLLVRSEYQEKIAWSIYTGVMEYFAAQ